MESFEIDQATINQAQKMRAESLGWRELHLRLYLAGKGCDGFDYGVTFDKKEEGDLEFLLHKEDNLYLICDIKTFDFVKGSTITWVDDERGKGFLVANPRHKRFRGKFYKRKFWQERLLGQEPADLTEQASSLG